MLPITIFLSLLILTSGFEDYSDLDFDSELGLSRTIVVPGHLQQHDQEPYDPRHLQVDKTNPHCDFSRTFGPLCNMTGVDAVLSVKKADSLFEPSILEIEIHNATAVVLYPICIPWVQVFGVNGLTTSQLEEGKPGAHCSTWLRAYESHLDALTIGLKDASLVESSVDVVNLHGLRDFLAISTNISIIEGLEWEGYTGLFKSANIRDIISMQCNDNVSISDSTITRIGSHGLQFLGKQMLVNSTVFKHVNKEGIQIMSGEAQFNNTIFKQIGRYGITVDPAAKIRMTNVTIEKCTSPCLLFPNSGSAALVNVTVAGEPLDGAEGIIGYSEDDVAFNDKLSLDHFSNECTTKEDNIECDFSGISEEVFVSGSDNRTFNAVTIHNCESVHIINACNMSLHLVKSSGSYTKHDVRGSSSQAPVCPTGGSITAVNTMFHLLVTKNLDLLNLFQCRTMRVHTETVKVMELRESQLGMLAVTVQDRAVWNSSVASLSNTTIDGYLQAEGMNFDYVSRLVINSNEINSTIVNSLFGSTSHSGLLVNGSLYLRNVTFFTVKPFPIYLTENGHLYLEDVVMPDHALPYISVTQMDQVTWLRDRPRNVSQHVYVRPTPPPSDILDGASQAGPAGVNCSSWNSYRFLSRFTVRMDTKCNYTGTQNGDLVQVRSTEARNSPHIHSTTLTIIAAKRLVLTDVCGISLVLLNVLDASMNESSTLCQYSLTGSNSTLRSILNTPSKITLTNSTVTTIETPHMLMMLVLRNSSVQTLNTWSSTTVISRTSVNTVEYLSSFLSTDINESKIGEIESILVENHLQITNSRIREILPRAIHVKSSLIFENVTIETLHRNAVIAYRNSGITWKNVTVLNGSISFLNYSQASINMELVTMNGLPVNIRNILTIGAPGTAHRSTTGPIPTIPPPPPPSPSIPPPPPATTLPPKDHSRSSSSPSPKSASSATQVTDVTQPWVKWAAAGATIFLVLCAVLLVLSIILFVKSNHRGEQQGLVPRMVGFFQLRGGRATDELRLDSELHVDDSTDRELQSTNYSRLPS